MAEREDNGGGTRKTFYVSVGPGQVLEDKEAAAFEFEVRASDVEIGRLREMFIGLQDADEDKALRFHGNPLVSDPTEDETYNRKFRDIYALLHQLGTEETRRHIESMNVLR